MAKLFGFKIPDGEDKKSKGVVSPVPPTDEDKSPPRDLSPDEEIPTISVWKPEFSSFSLTLLACHIARLEVLVPILINFKVWPPQEMTSH